LNGFLLDTNALSEILKVRPARSFLRALAKTPRRALCTSSVCVMELRFGAARAPLGDELWARIQKELLTGLRIAGFGPREARRAGELLADLEHRGLVVGTEDVIIAATALENDLTVVTRNVRHFARVEDLRVESWWS
jgi:tRNA(fMet)-specific endonuclease VapC